MLSRKKKPWFYSGRSVPWLVLEVLRAGPRQPRGFRGACLICGVAGQDMQYRQSIAGRLADTRTEYKSPRSSRLRFHGGKCLLSIARDRSSLTHTHTPKSGLISRRLRLFHCRHLASDHLLPFGFICSLPSASSALPGHLRHASCAAFRYERRRVFRFMKTANQRVLAGPCPDRAAICRGGRTATKTWKCSTA
jgi:hypothetical protein